MSAVLFDTLAFAQRLEQGGFTVEQSRTAASALADAFTDSVATKDDIKELLNEINNLEGEGWAVRKDLTGQIEAVRKDLTGQIDAVRKDLTGQIDAVRKDLTGQIDAVRKDLTGEIEAVRKDLTGQIEAVSKDLTGQIDTIKHEMASLRVELGHEIRTSEQRTTIRLGGMIVVGVGILLAANFFA